MSPATGTRGTRSRPAASYAAARASANDGRGPSPRGSARRSSRAARPAPPFRRGTRARRLARRPRRPRSAASVALLRIPLAPRAPPSPPPPRPLDPRPGHVAARRRRRALEEIAVEQRDDRLRLRVTEAAVELEHPRTVVGQHQTRVEQPDERAPRWRARRAPAGAPPRRAPRPRRRRPDRGRVRAHPAGVRPSSPSYARLKSCAGTSGRAMRPSQIAKSDTSGPSRSSSTTMSRPTRQRAHRIVDLRLRAADEDALPCGEPVRLHDARWPCDRRAASRSARPPPP